MDVAAMRILLLALVLGNLALYGWTQGWIAAPGEGRAVARHERQVNAGLLTVEPAEATPAIAGNAAAGASNASPAATGNAGSAAAGSAPAGAPR